MFLVGVGTGFGGAAAVVVGKEGGIVRVVVVVEIELVVDVAQRSVGGCGGCGGL